MERVRAELAEVMAVGGLEVVVVDDGSPDDTAGRARAAGADQVLRLDPNAGKGAAVRAGIAWGPAMQRAGDFYGHSVNLASRVTGIARPRGCVRLNVGFSLLALCRLWRSRSLLRNSTVPPAGTITTRGTNTQVF